MSFLRPLLTPCRGGRTRTPCRGGRTRVSQKSSLFQHRLFTSYFKENFEYITLLFYMQHWSARPGFGINPRYEATGDFWVVSVVVNRVGEAASSWVAQSWCWGSQITVKKVKLNLIDNSLILKYLKKHSFQYISHFVTWNEVKVPIYP